MALVSVIEFVVKFSGFSDVANMIMFSVEDSSEFILVVFIEVVGDVLADVVV